MTPSTSSELMLHTGFVYSTTGHDAVQMRVVEEIISVLVSFALSDEEHPAVKADILPSESAHFTDPECAVVDKRQQGLVVQPARFEMLGNTSLGEYSGKFLRLSDFRKHQTSGLFESHDLVVVLQPKDRKHPTPILPL